MSQIKFGTDGWRAIIAKDYTVDNVKRVSSATALWVKQRPDMNQKIVLGYDCRFAGKLFAETAASVFAKAGLKVIMDKHFVSTPMISMAALKHDAALGIIITASHNPASYNGYKVKANFGGPALPKTISEIEELIPDSYTEDLEAFSQYEEKGLIDYADFEARYLAAVKEGFDLTLINDSDLGVVYDAMYGAGQSVIKKILPSASYLHCDYNPSFMGTAPEPIHKNLSELSLRLADNDTYSVGLANDGDADRIGMYNASGVFIDSHHLILLLIQYLHKVKGYTGKVVVAASVTDKVKKLCEIYGLPIEVTKVGFKYIAGKMLEGDVLLGGEESGGIAVKGHIPERDGIWVGLLLIEFMAQENKTMDELIEEIYAQVGSFFYQRNDLRLTDAGKEKALEIADAGIKAFGDYEVQSEDRLDGFRYTLPDEAWCMVRASGTEPVLRLYAEGKDEAHAQAILAAMESTLVP